MGPDGASASWPWARRRGVARGSGRLPRILGNQTRQVQYAARIDRVTVWRQGVASCRPARPEARARREWKLAQASVHAMGWQPCARRTPDPRIVRGAAVGARVTRDDRIPYHCPRIRASGDGARLDALWVWQLRRNRGHS